MKFLLNNIKLNDLRIVKTNKSKYILCLYDKNSKEDTELYLYKNKGIYLGKTIKSHKSNSRINITFILSNAYEEWMSFENLSKQNIIIGPEIIFGWINILESQEFIQLLNDYFSHKPNDIQQIYIDSKKIKQALLDYVSIKPIFKEIYQETQQPGA